MKICTKCKVETPMSEITIGGKGSWCKSCSREYVKRFRLTQRGKAYSVYNNMLERCYNINGVRYEKYGGAGVIVCDEWLSENGFENFFLWYKKQENIKENYQLDKDIICNEKNIKPHIYSPETCKFVSREKNQRNYSDLLKNNTSGYTGVVLNKNKKTWDFRLTRSLLHNINRGGFLTALEAAKAREACIIVNNLDFKLEHVGTTMNINEYSNKKAYTFYGSSNYSMIRKKCNKYTGTVKLSDGTRKSIGMHETEYLASKEYNNIIKMLKIEKINKKSILFGFENIKKGGLI